MKNPTLFSAATFPATAGPLVKICGLTRPEDLECALRYGADAIGVIAVPGSPRCLTPARIAALFARTADRALKVLVTALAGPEELEELSRVVRQTGPDIVQLHGNETAALIGTIRKTLRIPVWKAYPLLTAEALNEAAASPADGVVADARRGGSGQRCDWSLATELARARPLLLAGGITAENALEALSLTGAAGVDVCSGVEAAPGRKDHDKIQQLLNKLKRIPVS